MTWSRKKIFVATLLGSILNLAVAFSVAHFIGIIFISIWLSFRAYAQLVLALVPSRLNSLLYLSHSKRNKDYPIKQGYINGGILFVAMSSFILTLSEVVPEIELYRIELIFYLAAFQIAGYESILVKSMQRSDILLKSGVIEVFCTLIILIILLESADFSLFIILSALKEFIKFSFMHWFRSSNCQPQGSLPIKESILKKYSLVHVVRGSIQIISQYGDRMIFPIIFQLAQAGQAALGASCGMLIAMMSTSAFTWAMPKTLSGQNMSQWLLREWFKLLILSATITASLSLVTVVLNEIIRDDLGFNIVLSQTFIAAFFFSSVSSINFLSMGISKERLKGKSYIRKHFIIILIPYLVIAISATTSASTSVCIYLGAIAAIGSFLIINMNQVRKLMNYTVPR